MQKKFIALAVAGLVSGAAFAQSNVTVYGVIDNSFENVQAGGAASNAAGTSGQSLNSRSRIQSNSSYLGFKGTESLGNGLSAVFQVESQFAGDNSGNASNGTAAAGGTFATRDTFVGVNGSFGEIKLGNLSTPYRSAWASMDLMPGATGVGNTNSLIGRVNVGASAGALGTANNFSQAAGGNMINTIGRSQGIQYTSPTFSGVTGALFYSSNENKVLDTANTAQTDAHILSGSIGYANGPIKAVYAYTRNQDAVTSTGISGAVGGSSFKSHYLAGGYTFNNTTTVNLVFNQNTVDLENNAAPAAVQANQVKNNVWALGLKHVMGMHEIVGQYAVVNNGSVSNSNAASVENSSDRGANQITLRYGYNFSKRTQAYALYSRINNQSNGNYDFAAGTNAAQSNAAVFAVGAGADPQAFGVGLRHSF